MGAGVEVTLRVTGMPLRTETARSMASGGTTILASLKSICETGRPKPATRALYWLFDHLEFVLPARTRSEHWPLTKEH